MNTRLTGNEPGLVGYWNFDDGTANDLSPFGNHGELGGDAKIIDSDLPSLDEPLSDTPTANFTLSLGKGLNMISLPVKPSTPFTAQSFIDKLGSTVLVWFNVPQQTFKPYIPNISQDFILEGGQGYIVNVLEPKEVTFTGTIWANAPPAINGIWAFVVGGQLPDKRETPITIRHLESNRVIQGIAFNGRFAVPFVDMNRQHIIEPGDTLEIEVDSETIIHHQVSVGDITRAYTVVHVPRRFVLYQNYPNPFNPETWIPYQLAHDAEVQISIYDISGKMVRRLNLGHKPAGYYVDRGQAVYWDGKSETGEQVSSGLYFYQLRAGDFTSVKRMVILK